MVTSKAKEKIKNIFEKIKPSGSHKKIYSFLLAGILVVSLFLWWLFGSNMGWIARTSWEKTFDTTSIHLITVYDATGDPICVYEGTYTVEDRGKYWIVMNQQTGERINVYGQATIIIDTPKEFAEKHVPQVEKGDNTNGR